MNREKIVSDKNSLQQPFKVEWYTAVAVIFFIVAALVVKFFQSDDQASFHAEIFPSDAISYIDEDKLVALADGNYMLAIQLVLLLKKLEVILILHL